MSRPMSARGRHNVLQRYRPADDPAVAEDYARELVDSWPPLTDEQRARLAALLMPAPIEGVPTGAGGR